MPYDATTTGTQVAADLASHIHDKVVLVTGISPKSLGASFVQIIAAHSPKLLILAGRALPKARETAAAIASIAPGVETRLLELNLASQKSVRKAADEVLAYPEEKIDVLVLNAGIMATPYAVTEDGLEMQFGSNHIGHFLFANLIMGKVVGAKDGGRVVSVSSTGHRFGPVRFGDLGFDGGKEYDPWRAYGQAKTANVLFAVSLAEKLASKGLVAFSLHPGGIWTNLANHLEMNFKPLFAVDRQLGNVEGWTDLTKLSFKNLDQGVATHIRAAFDPTLKECNGRYLEDSDVVDLENVKTWARDKIEAERLWKVSEELVGQKFGYV